MSGFVARWEEIAAAEPEFAGAVQAFMDLGVHKTIATLRSDGSPRISGTEAVVHNGDIWLGSMHGAMKARDLKRDPRFALHSHSIDPPAWKGDAKIAGRAVEVTDAAQLEGVPGAGEASDAHFFRLDVTEVVLVQLREDRKALVIESWHEGRAGIERLER